MLHPDSGSASVHGYDVVRDGAEVRARIGVALVNERSLFWRMSGRENLRLFAATSGVQRNLRGQQIDDVLDELELKQIADQRVANLSAGQRQRLIIARAAIARPPVLLLSTSPFADSTGAALTAPFASSLARRKMETPCWSRHRSRKSYATWRIRCSNCAMAASAHRHWPRRRRWPDEPVPRGRALVRAQGHPDRLVVSRHVHRGRVRDLLSTGDIPGSSRSWLAEGA